MSDSIVRCSIDVHDESLLHRSAELKIVRHVEVHDSRGVDSSDVVLRRKIESLQRKNEIDLHRASLKAFSYRGREISIEIHSELTIDDGVLFDTTIKETEEMHIAPRPEVAMNAKEQIEPADAFNFARNLAAIPPANRVITLGLMFLGAIVIAINSWVGIHDQFAPEPMVWFYDHRDSDGDSEMPIQKSLVASGAVGAAIWFAVKRQLRRYMKFELIAPKQICRRDSLRASALMRGRSRVALENVVLRVVACNMELGQYKRGSGTKERTVSFREPVRAVVLYEQRIARIPPDSPVEHYLPGEVRFEPMFRSLYPPQPVGSRHGLLVYWEVQLIHDELVDQELIGPVDCFPWQDFLTA